MAKSEVKKSALFTKEDFLKAKKYEHMKDLVSALLDKDKTYSIDEVDELIQNYLKGEVE